jgi:hypothetical protein
MRIDCWCTGGPPGVDLRRRIIEVTFHALHAQIEILGVQYSMMWMERA